MADLGLAQLHDMRTNAEMIANLDPFGPPLIADMDHGYGGELADCKTLDDEVGADSYGQGLSWFPNPSNSIFRQV
jgi:methylisocitrate lyase